MSTASKVYLFLALAISVFPVLGLAKISGSSEAREAHVARVILQSSEWILPDRNGYVPSKPILHHWLISSFSLISGEVNEFTARLPSAFLGILLIVLVVNFFMSAARFLDIDPQKYSLLSALILVSTYGYFRMIFSSMVDLSFAFFVSATILAGLKALIEGKTKTQGILSNKDWLVFFALSAFASLAKGPLGLLLPAVFLFISYAVLYGFMAAIKDCFKPRLAWLLWVLIVVPWYYLAYLKSKAAFLERQLFFENIERFVGGQNVNHEAFWFYLPSFLTRMAPWSILLLIAGFFFFWQLKKNTDYNQLWLAKVIKAISFSLLGVILFFSISSGKRHSYLLPLFPIFSVLLCMLLSFILSVKTDSKDLAAKNFVWLKNPEFEDYIFRIARYLGFIVFVLLLVFIAGLNFYNASDPALQISKKFIFTNVYYLLFAPLLSLAFVFLVNSKNIQLNYLSVIFLFASLFSSILSCIYGIKGEFRDYPKMADNILEKSAGRKLYAVRDKFDELLDPIFFYVAQPVTVISKTQTDQGCPDANGIYMIRDSLFDYPANIYKKDLRLEEAAGNPKSLNSRAIALFSCIN